MNYSQSELKQFCETYPKLVNRKESNNYPGLFVLKYSRGVFYDNLFPKYPILRELRGLVVDADYNIVTKSFQKIFNYLENGAGSTLADDEYVYMSRKVNGFMAAVTNYNGQLLISTTGSLDSVFCDYAREYLHKIDPDTIFPNETLMFEICHPLDPHIVQEKPGAYFLATVYDGFETYSFDNIVPWVMIDHLEDCEINVDEWRNPIPSMTFGQAKKIANEAQHEGFVIQSQKNGETFKIKSKSYTIKKMMARKADILKLNKQWIPEEYFDLVDNFAKDESFKTLDEQSRLRVMEQWIQENHNVL